MNLQDTSTIPDLFEPFQVGPLTLPNRIVMAPLTRSRAANGNVPTQLHALYYAQRASAGLIIAEATQVAPEGQGYISTPGIHGKEQVENWKCVTKAVHVVGGRIVLQLWHVGRTLTPPFSLAVRHLLRHPPSSLTCKRLLRTASNRFQRREHLRFRRPYQP